MIELYELALSDDGVTFSGFEPFDPGEVRDLAKFVKFRLTLFGDFAEDDYRLRGFSGIADDATLQEGGFGISPFGRFPFGDGGVCLEGVEDSIQGDLDLSASLDIEVTLAESASLGLSGALVMVETDVTLKAVSGSLGLSGTLAVAVIISEAGTVTLSGDLSTATTGESMYSWWSIPNPPLGVGSRFYAERNGAITNIYAWSSDAPPNQATFNVLKNGATIYTSNTKPSISGGATLGPDTTPNTTAFVKGDYFTIQITSTGGLVVGTFGVVIEFESTIA
jgi:hypothetical protein